jgi:ribosomal subunit interface protein
MSLENTIKITFRHGNLTPAVSAHIKNLFSKCYRFYHKIIHCNVIIHQEHCTEEKELLHCVSIVTEIPKHTLIAKDNTHTNLYTAIANAFDAIKKQLEEINTQRHEHHAHDQPLLRGVIKTISHPDLYGIIENNDGDSLYFSDKSVKKNGFCSLKIGQEVRFTQCSTPQGEQARKVKAIK